MLLGVRTSFYNKYYNIFFTHRIIWLGLQLVSALGFSYLVYTLCIQVDSHQNSQMLTVYIVLFLVLLLSFLFVQQFLFRLNRNNVNFHESLSRLIELSSDWYWQQDENLVITKMLYKGKTIFHEPEKEIEPFLGKSLRDIKIIEVLDKSMTWQDFVEINQAGKPFESICLQYFSNDGLRRVFEASGMPYFNKNGVLKGYHCISLNVTQKWLGECFITIQRNFLQGVLLSTPISQLGQQYVSEFQNCLIRQADIAMGYRESITNSAEVFQSSDNFRISARLFDRLWALPEENLKTIESYGDQDLIRAGCLPSSFFYECQNFSAYSVVWAVLKKGLNSNQPDYWVVLGQKGGSQPEHNDVIRVITGLRLMGLGVERKTFEYQLQALNQTLEARIEERTAELTAVNQELKAFSYTVSHDLRAPLRAIDGFSTILKEDYADHLPTDALDLLSRVSSNARYMGELINALLDFSRLLHIDLEKVDVDLDEMVKSLLTSLNAYNRIKVIITGKLPVVRADSVLIRLVWQNLIENAIKFSSKETQPIVTISHERIMGGYQFVIQDNGAGFDMNYKDKLFRVFTRLHHNRDFEGTGVGLAIVKRIIERHNGQIDAESDVGKGAKFVFTLNDPGV